MLLCDRCGAQIEEQDGFDSMERGVEYDFEHLCEECYEALEEGERDEDDELEE